MPRHYTRTPLAERFWTKVEKTDGCWWWRGANGGPNRYGLLQTGRDGTRKIKDYAHRVSYRLAYGEIPAGLWVLHRCDNRLCVRPDHLFLGTHDENMADMRAKARQGLGSRNSQALLTENDVRSARALFLGGELSISEIARRYRVSQASMSFIINNKTWKHLK